MKKVIAVLAVAIMLFGTGATWAASSVLVYGGVMNKYVIGNGIISAKDPVAQGGVKFSFENGTYLDLWLSRRFSDAEGNAYGNESDLTLGWSGAVGSVSVDTGVAVFNLYPTTRVDRNDVTQLFAEVSPKTAWTIGTTTLSPYVRLEVVSSTGMGFRNEPIYFVGLRHTWSATGRLSVLQRLQISEQPDLPGVSGGVVVSYKLQVPYTIGGITVTPSYERIHPIINGRPKSNILGLQFARVF